MSGTRVPSSPGPQYDPKWMYWFWDWVRNNRANYVSTGLVPMVITGEVLGTTTTGTLAATLSTTGVAAGTYSKVVVDVKGRVTSGGSPFWTQNKKSVEIGETLSISTNYDIVLGAHLALNGTATAASTNGIADISGEVYIL